MSEENEAAAKPSSQKKYSLINIRGLLFPAPYLVTNFVENAIDFKPRDTDIFVVTYPKCGTTWTQYIIWEIIHKGAVPPSPNQMMFRHFPFLEYTGTESLDDLPSPRTMKTHLPFNLQPFNQQAKYIYIVRNPWDCSVSYYHHHQIDPAMTHMSFDEYLELFTTGEIGWGDFLDHTLSWFEHKDDPNVLFLTYEGMKKDKRKTLLAIAKFLGQSYYESIQDEEVIANCLKHSDFKYMKEMGMFFSADSDEGLPLEEIKVELKRLGDVDRSTASSGNFKEVEFFRQGEVGDWKNHLTPVQVKKLNEYVLRKLKGTKMEGFWQLPMEETAM